LFIILIKGRHLLRPQTPTEVLPLDPLGDIAHSWKKLLRVPVQTLELMLHGKSWGRMLANLGKICSEVNFQLKVLNYTSPKSMHLGWPIHGSMGHRCKKH